MIRFGSSLFAAMALAIPGWIAGSAIAQESHTHSMPARPARAELGTSAAFGPDGALYVASKRDGHVVVERSNDGGATWESPVTVNRDPESISADGENRPKIAFAQDGGMLVSWTKPLSKPYTGEIRFARSDDGRQFSPPITVHRDRSEITHRFESLTVTGDGKVLVTWIDKRDLEAAGKKGGYQGAAIYGAISADGGKTFQPEKKIADHSCECCRIAMARDSDGAPLLLWRHVFAPNERDHALARLKPDGTLESVQRATFDHWKVDACPHHGPSLAVDEKGTKHAVWFNQKDGEGHVYYGRLQPRNGGIAVEGQRPIGGPQAAHADVAAKGGRLAIAWKEFDGERTRLHALLSTDGGMTFSPRALAATDGASDQPRIIAKGDDLYAFWRTDKEGFRLYPLP
ncbi:MAG: sialidase family protein [Actinomycetota bacterium]